MIPLATPHTATMLVTQTVTLVIQAPIVQQVRLRLLDELERLTGAEVNCGTLVRRMSGACLQGLHLELVGGSSTEVTDWMAEATTLLHEAAGHVTPTQPRLAVVSAYLSSAPPAIWQGGAA